MPIITFVTADGWVRRVEARLGDSMMQAAVENAVAGILGQCGGTATCGTCHVWVDMATVSDSALLPPLGSREDEVLDGSLSERRDTSRLACQLPVTGALDGVCVEVPGELW